MLKDISYDRRSIDWLENNCGTCTQMVAGICSRYAERAAFGFRNGAVLEKQSYRQLWQRITALASGANQPDVVPSHQATQDICHLSTVVVNYSGALHHLQ